MIIYEYPLSERIRTMLRLEDLFGKAAHFQQQQSAYDHHAALLTLFEIIEVASRADLKIDLIHELERQRQALLVYRNKPEISEEILSGALYEIEQSSAALLGMTGKIGQYIRENEWLMSIKNRANIPGGVCEFDLPSYHYWQHREVDDRQEFLMKWLNPLNPLRDSIDVVLRLLRASGRTKHQIAKNATFQLMLSGTASQLARTAAENHLVEETDDGRAWKASQLVRIAVENHLPYIPETSANKYILNIRFTHPGNSHKSRHVEKGVDVPFDITFCYF